MNRINSTAQLQRHKLYFLLFNIVAFIAIYFPVSSLALNNDLYSHIPLIPAISAYFLYSIRKEVFFCHTPSYKAGVFTIILAAVIYITATVLKESLTPNDHMSIVILSVLIFWTGGFIFFNGTEALKKAAFPVAFLLLMIPIPSMLLKKIVTLLQHASADLSYIIFELTNVPVFREGLTFHLPNISIYVAEECSGIRSSIALFIAVIIMQHMFLKKTSTKLIFLLTILPLSIFKNAVRIVTLSLLAVYVDVSFLTNSLLHQQGGILFFLIALAVIMPLLWILIKYEKGTDTK